MGQDRISGVVWTRFCKFLVTRNHSCAHHTSVPAEPGGSCTQLACEWRPVEPLPDPRARAARCGWIHPAACFAWGGSGDLGLAEGPGQMLNIFVLSPVSSGSGREMH